MKRGRWDHTENGLWVNYIIDISKKWSIFVLVVRKEDSGNDQFPIGVGKI
jgi:hypothetical protein